MKNLWCIIINVYETNEFQNIWGKNRIKEKNWQFHSLRDFINLLLAINKIYTKKKISKGRRSEENPLPTTNKRKPHIKERSAISLGTFFSAFCNFPDVLNYGLGLSSDIQHIYHISSSNLWLQMFSICLLKIYFILHHLLSIHFTLSSWSVILRFTFLTKYLFHTLLFFVLL